MKKPAPLVPLLAGLALGATCVGVARHLVSAPSAASPAPAAAQGAGSVGATAGPAVVSTHSILLPTRLAEAEAGEALAAWLALGEPPSGSSAKPAGFAAQAASLRALLTILPDSIFPRLLSALVAREGDDARRLRQAAFDVWIERAAPDVAKWALAIAPGKTFDARDRTRLSRQAAKAWASADFDAAYAWVAALGEAELSRALAGALLSELAATDPVRALALAQGGGPDFFKTTQVDLFKAWSVRDPAAAVQALGVSLLEDDRNSWQIQEALCAWIGRDPSAAVAWIIAQPVADQDRHSSLMQQTIWRVAENHQAIHPLAEALTANPDRENRFQNLASLLNSWGRADPAAALSWLDTLPDAAERADLLERHIPDDWPDLRDQEQYLPFALHLPPGDVRTRKIAGLLAGWSRKDPDAALAWLRAHDDPSLAPAAARVQGSLIAALASSDPAAALARWRELPDADSRRAATPALVESWAKTDPVSAARWSLEQLPARPEFDFKQYDKLSPAEQTALQRAFNEQESQEQSFSKSAASWFQQDPLGYVAWAGTLPDPKQRETAFNALASSSGAFDADAPDPVDRAAVLSHISNPALRDRVLTQHVRQWMNSDLPSARAWIESHDSLSAEAAAKLIAQFPGASN